MKYTIGTVVFEDWIITKELGEGANGVVYEIQKKDFEPPIKSALKVIQIPKSQTDVISVMSEGMDKKSVTSYFREIVDDVLREIKVMVALKSHPNIVKYEDHCVIQHSEGVGWDILIRMELLKPLTKWSIDHPLDERETLRLGCEISSVLKYAKDHHICHRDVKPENILVDTNVNPPQFKLGDFGIARMIERTTANLSKKGTVNYMAPEVYWETGKYDQVEQVDIYSLGIVLYRFLNRNRLPFYPDVTQNISHSAQRDAINRRMHGEDIPDPVNAGSTSIAVIRKAYAYRPEDRYESMEAFHDALKRAYNEIGNDRTISVGKYGKEDYDATDRRPQPPHERPEVSFEEKKKPYSKKLIMAGKGILVIIVLALGMIIGMTIKNASGSDEERESQETTETISERAESEETESPETASVVVYETESTDVTEADSQNIILETDGIEVDSADTSSNIKIESEDTSYDDMENWYYISSTYEKGIAVRSEPTGEADLLTRLPYGTEFRVETISDNWGYTTVNGVTGWVELSYADHVSSNKADRNEETGWYYISSTYEKGIAVRSEPTGESQLLCRLPYGTEFYVEAVDDNWGYTTVNNVTGWIELTYADKMEG